MSLPHASSGDVIDLQPYQQRLQEANSTAIVRTEHLELIRTVLHAGKSVPEHEVSCEMTLQCIEGCFTVRAHGKEIILQPGQMIFLAAHVPHTLHATEESSALMTLLRHCEH
jgi:quercetin dioxygenase-like cupin family protein